MLCRTRCSWRWLAIPALMAGSLSSAAAVGQEEGSKDTDVSEVAEPRARFVLTSRQAAEPETTADAEEARDTDGVLRAGPAGLSRDEPGDAGDAETGAIEAEHWLLDRWPVVATEPTDENRLIWSGAEVVQRAALPRSRARALPMRTSVAYGVEASQLTLLSGGKQMFAFEVADGLTLAGVGSRRLWTERDRAFVVAAEAGWQLTPRAGLHLGYEVLQTPTGGALPPSAGGDSIFARFQLRF